MLHKIIIHLILFQSAVAQRPGAMFQLNRRGATELANAGVDLLNRRLPGYHLQDVNGRSLNADQFENRSVLLPEDQGETFLQLLSDDENKGEEKKWYKYWLTDNVVERFSADKQQSQITFRQPNQIRVTVGGISAKLTGHYKVKIGWGWVSLSKSGDYTATTSGSSLSVGAAFRLANGHPALTDAGCECHLNDFSITFHGGIIDEIINWFKHAISSWARGKMEPRICDVMNGIVRDEGNTYLQTVPLDSPLHGAANGFHVDYALVDQPTVSNAYLAIPIKGKFWYTGHQNDPQIPTASGSVHALQANEMICVNFDGDEILNSLAYAYKVSPFNPYIIHPNIIGNLPENVRRFFRCSCPDDHQCIGSFLNINSSHCTNGSYVAIDAQLSADPTFHFNSSGVFVRSSGSGLFYIVWPDGTRINLFRLDAIVGVKIGSNLRLDGWTIKGSSHLYESHLNITVSFIGQISDPIVDQIWNLGLHALVDALLNFLLEIGIPIAPIPHVTPVRPRFQFAEHLLTFCTDVVRTSYE